MDDGPGLLAMRVLIAPDCYCDSLTAAEAAEAICAGWSLGRPDDDVTLAPHEGQACAE